MNKKIALIVGGSNGIGLSIAQQLLQKEYEKIYILDRVEPDVNLGEQIIYVIFNLLNDDYSILEQFKDIDTLIITAGFGRIAEFDEITDIEIINSYKVNAMAVIRIIKYFYPRIIQQEDFYCAVMGSIAGLISSPMFAVYGSTKAAICKFIESINIEIEKKGSSNKILNISPGQIKGTKFNNDGINNLEQTRHLANDIIDNMLQKNTLFIPQYEEVFKGVLYNYHSDPHEFGMKSFEYKKNSGRTISKPQIKIGYLSGTFDLFHIGHLNLFRRAKEYCDYLVVGVHKDALHKGKQTFISFEERLEIVQNIKYVDKVIPSYQEDMDAYPEVQYDFLFVGSDYEGSERFQRYEKYFEDKDVKIIYFPYTKGTSSSQLRAVIEKSSKD